MFPPREVGATYIKLKPQPRRIFCTKSCIWGFWPAYFSFKGPVWGVGDPPRASSTPLVTCQSFSLLVETIIFGSNSESWPVISILSWKGMSQKEVTLCKKLSVEALIV